MNNKLTQNSSPKRLLTLLLGTFVAFMAMLIMQPTQKVYAATTDTAIGKQLPLSGSGEIYPGGANFRPNLAVGTGGFDGTFMYAKVYVPVDAATGMNIAANLTIHNGGGKCAIDLGNPDVTYSVEAMSNNEMWTSGGENGFYRSVFSTSKPCDDNNNPVISIPAGSGAGSQITKHKAYSVFYFQATINNDPATTNEKEFWLEINNGLVGLSAAVKFYGYSAIDGHDRGYFAIYKYDASSNWNYGFQVAPNCNQYTSPAPVPDSAIRMYDADWGVYYQPNLSYSAIRDTLGAGAPAWSSPIASAAGAQLGGNHEYSQAGAMNFTASNAYRYKLNIYDIAPINTIQIKIPFDQFDSRLTNESCTPPPPVANAAVCVGGSTISLPAGRSGNATVTLKNPANTAQTQYTPWTSAYNLVRTGSIPGGANGSVNGANPPSPPVNQGEQRTFSVNVSLPASPSTSPYIVNFQMRDASNNNFGDKCPVTINVIPPGTAGCSAYTSPSQVAPGAQISVTVTSFNWTGYTWSNTNNSQNWVVAIFGQDGQNNVYRTGQLGNVANGSQSAPWTINTTASGTPGLASFSFTIYHYVGGANPYQPIGSCSATYNVYDYPVGWWIGGNPNCRDNAGQTWWASNRQAPINMRITLIVSNGQTFQRDWVHDPSVWMYNQYPGGWNWRPFVDWPGPGLPAFYQYTAYVDAQDTAGGWHRIADNRSYGPCVKASCSASGVSAPEPGESISASGISIRYQNYTGYDLPNYGARLDWSGGVAVNPPTHDFGGTISGSAPYTDFGPPSGTTITATSPGVITITATFGGVQYPEMPDSARCTLPINPATRPFFQVKSGDIKTGGGFESDQGCPSTSLAGYISPRTTSDDYSGGIRAFGDPSSGSNPGSTVDFGAYALGLIAKNTNAKIGFKSLSNALFANIGSPPLPNDYGGFLNSNSQAHCVQDFFTTTRTSATLNTLPNLSTSGQYSLNPGNFNGGPVPPGRQITVYVDGDVRITGNITYVGNWNPDDQTTVPYFTLIARGNITVASSVTQLDGLYVAQPKIGSGGTVVAGTGVFKTCDGNCLTLTSLGGQLTINGVVIAQHLQLLRSYGTLINIPPAPAEIINFVPSMVIGLPNFAPQATGLQGIFSLPPVF